MKTLFLLSILILQYLVTFCGSYLSKSLIEKSSWFENIDIIDNIGPTCIDLLMTKFTLDNINLKCFQNSSVFETYKFDFHKLTMPLLRTYVVNQKLRILEWNECKKNGSNSFRYDRLD